MLPSSRPYFFFLSILFFLTPPFSPAQPDQKFDLLFAAEQYLLQNRLTEQETNSLFLIESSTTNLNGRPTLFHFRWQQHINKIPIYNQTVQLTLTEAARSVAFLPPTHTISTLAIDDPTPILSATTAALRHKYEPKTTPSLIYFPTSTRLRLAWDLSNKSSHIIVASDTGELLHHADWLISEQHSSKNEQNNASPPLNSSNEPNALSSSPTYFVFPHPATNPAEINQTNLINPAHPTASPFGWHDNDAILGADYSYTKGNNLFAYIDQNNDNLPDSYPDGGTELNFYFPFNPNQPPEANQTAAVTNLFYWSNLAHDLFFHYGFDEASGNFQQFNFSQRAQGNDPLLAETQNDGSHNNAIFTTPPDGSSPRLELFNWTYSSPERDAAFDATIILHEYGHGVSKRLAGGRSNSDCLDAAYEEQMGEGWSDFWAIAFTMKETDTPTTPRTIASYTMNNPDGIRTYPYTTNIAANPLTYNDIKTANSAHEVGTIWSSILWELNWALINRHSFNPDLFSHIGGNNKAIRLITEGIKITPCNPGFVDARDAILQLEEALYHNEDRCLLWNAFAKRGLGFSATQGSSADQSDGAESFDLPPFCSQPTMIQKEKPACSTTPISYTIDFPPDTPLPINLSIPNPEPIFEYTFSPKTVTNPARTTNLTLSPSASILSNQYTIPFLANEQPYAIETNIYATPPSYAYINLNDNDFGTQLTPTFSWPTNNETFSYTLQISQDPFFTDLIYTTSTTAAEHTILEQLHPQTAYYARIIAHNQCGEKKSAALLFFTGQEELFCSTIQMPINGNAPTIESELLLVTQNDPTHLSLSLDITHQWIGDLSVQLINPKQEKTAVLLHRPLFPQNHFGCSSQNLNITFTDHATTLANEQCNETTPAISGPLRPIDPLSTFSLAKPNGRWQLSITDHYPQDGNGILNQYCLQLTTPPSLIDLSDLPPIYGIATHNYNETLHLGASNSADTTLSLNHDNLSDDGVQFIASEKELSLLITTSNNPGYLSCWFDWNKNGRFSPAEQNIATFLPPGEHPFTIPFPLTYNPILDQFLETRCRLSTDSSATNSPIGPAPDGEVEDYQLPLLPFTSHQLLPFFMK